MSNRTVVVTGAARGLGAVVARRFHEAGYRVALADIAIEPAQALARELSQDGSSACAIRIDVTSKRDFEAAREALLNAGARSMCSSTTPAHRRSFR
jgi:3-oxoacyl-[acyl-carrier protein] reductase